MVFILSATLAVPLVHRETTQAFGLSGFAEVQVALLSSLGVAMCFLSLLLCATAPGKDRGVGSLARPAAPEVISQSCLVQRRSVADPRTRST